MGTKNTIKLIKIQTFQRAASLKPTRHRNATPGVDNMPAELLQNGGEEATMTLTICAKESGNTRNGPKNGCSH